MASDKINANESVNAFRNCIYLLFKWNKNIKDIYAPPKPIFDNGFPVVFVKLEELKHYKKIPINQILGYKNICNNINYDEFNYTDYLPSIDTVLNNTINGYKTSIDYEKIRKELGK